MPTTFEWPVTPKARKSGLARSYDQPSPFSGYAGRTGLKPKVIRSKGVKNRRRRAFETLLGPRPGNFAFDAAFVNVLTFVIPVSREDRTYEPATLIGPPRFLTSTRAVLFTTCATVKRWRDHCFM